MESSAPSGIGLSRPGRFPRMRALAVTALANAKLAERRLGNAVLLTHDGYGHESRADPSTCVMQALGRYFTGLTTPARGTICPSDHGPFDPAFGQPAASR
jgi:TAP-like protein